MYNKVKEKLKAGIIGYLTGDAFGVPKVEKG